MRYFEKYFWIRRNKLSPEQQQRKKKNSADGTVAVVDTSKWNPARQINNASGRVYGTTTESPLSLQNHGLGILRSNGAKLLTLDNVLLISNLSVGSNSNV